jgi:hypothetical protein
MLSEQKYAAGIAVSWYQRIIRDLRRKGATLSSKKVPQ